MLGVLCVLPKIKNTASTKCRFWFATMGRNREAFGPSKHVKCACGWDYAKIFPPHKVEADLKSAQHSMHVQTTNMKASSTALLKPVERFPPSDDEEEGEGGDQGQEVQDMSGTEGDVAEFQAIPQVGGPAGDIPHANICPGIVPAALEDPRLFEAFYPFQLNHHGAPPQQHPVILCIAHSKHTHPRSPKTRFLACGMQRYGCTERHP